MAVKFRSVGTNWDDMKSGQVSCQYSRASPIRWPAIFPLHLARCHASTRAQVRFAGRLFLQSRTASRPISLASRPVERAGTAGYMQRVQYVDGRGA